MIIRVTQRDIKMGVPGVVSGCAVALALSRQLKPRRKLAVSVGDTYDIRGIENDIPLPKKVQRFITKFDASEPVKPFTFRTRRPRF